MPLQISDQLICGNYLVSFSKLSVIFKGFGNVIPSCKVNLLIYLLINFIVNVKRI